MQNYKKLLSSKVREDGRSQIIVRVDVSRTNRPQLKTGVWVLTDLFDAKKGGIVMPKRSKLNMLRYEEATKAQAELDDFCLKVSKIINAGEEAGLSITREWIERVIAIGFDGTTPIEELHIPEASCLTDQAYKGANSAKGSSYITTSERNAIAAFDLSKEIPGIQEARDIFVFQCLIGCRVSDLEKLTEDNINDGFLEYIPIKTRKKANQVRPRIPLCEQAKQIIARYEEFRKKDKKRRLLPFKYVSQYNEQIKRVFKVCGITRVVSVRDSKTGDIVMKSIDTIASSHMARRTFAGNVYKKVKDPNIVCKMTGHVEGSRAFTRYRKIDDEVLIDAVKAIE